MIFEFRFSIFDLRSGYVPERRFARRDENGCQLVSFLKQRLHSIRRHQLCSDDHLKPKAALVRFLLDNPSFIYKVRSRFRPAKRAIIGCHRTSAADNLIRDRIPASILGKGVGEFQDSQGECFRSLFHFVFVHACL